MELQQKMAEINLLQNQLADRKNEAIKIREDLYQQLATFKTEIETIVAQKNTKDFAISKVTPRIFYNLKLSGEIYHYIDQFNEKISFYQIGLDKLEYLYQLADDDLKIINTLTNLKIEALLAQIDVVILEYLPEAHRILISLDTTLKVNPETIWEKIIKN